ncbi:MAG: prepilin-type N-terminal cleavage/methylation domain-containing protein [Patescibacteria group bacterium]|nr:prepilin-type N-terminal cleavage/methylation domain-containing protein [Patescibacteria group bacterium]
MINKKGFTLTEALLYIAVSSILILSISSFFLWTNRSNIKMKVSKEVLNNSKIAMEKMSYEIKHAKSIYTSTSVFSTHPGQLSLETSNYAQSNEETSYIDFFICEQRLCLKKENQIPIILTSDKVEIKNLEFNQVATSSVQINLQIDYLAPTDKPEYQASINTTSTVSIRTY